MTQPHPQPMEITSKQMARIYNATDLKAVHSVMDEIRDIYTATHAPAASATESKFTCWRGDCKLHDDCIHSYGQEYPPCVDACAMQARKAERKQFAEQIRKKVKEINDSGTCPYGWEPEGRECNDDCTRCVVDAAIESLRGGA